MAKRRVLPGAYSGGPVGGGPEQGRSRPASGTPRKGAGSNGSHKGRSGGAASAAAHAPEAPKRAKLPQTKPTPAQTIAPALPDLAQRIERTGDLKSKCPGCGDAGVRTLF